jgi:Fic family protein
LDFGLWPPKIFETNIFETRIVETKSSQDTALRDIAEMVENGILVRSSEGGRSTSYSLAP